MIMDSEIKFLKDLRNLRSAPNLEADQYKSLLEELSGYLDAADWFTVGIMAPSSKLAIFVLREMESSLNWTAMKVVDKPSDNGPVFLKANQKTGDIYVRIEHGLGEGILISTHDEDLQKDADTFGPLPLDFFRTKD